MNHEAARAPGGPEPTNPPALPTTAYVVLGTLVVNDESLTAGEIKVRTQHTVGRFYWAPAVSHIRRELARLLDYAMVREETVHVGRRSMTVYEATAEGERALWDWADALPGDEQMVIKHPLMLKIWLTGEETDPEVLLSAIDRYLGELQKSIDEMMWGRKRGEELGLTDSSRRRYSHLVSHYTLRSLYAEMANVRQLRDEIDWNAGDAYARHKDHPTTTPRRRTPRPGRD